MKKGVWRILGPMFAAVLSSGCMADVYDETEEEIGTSEESIALAPGLPVGMCGSTGDEIFGKGPTYVNGHWTESNPYTMVLGRISPNDLPDAIAEAKQKNILLVLNMAGSRKLWTNETSNGCLMYDPSKYKARINEYIGVPGLKSAIDDRRIVIYVVDEPNIDDFCGSITPSEANAMGLYVKQKWPKAITILRTGAEVLKNGFSGQGPLGANFWSGFDYAWGLYKGWIGYKTGKSAAQWYAEEKQRMASMNLGMIYGMNILNHGGLGCWDYKKDGVSWGRVRGDNQSGAGQGVACNQGFGDETNWLASPQFVKSVLNVAIQDPDAPFVAMWTHVVPDSMYTEFTKYEIRNDFVSAYNSMINKGAQRTQWNGWRQAK